MLITNIFNPINPISATRGINVFFESLSNNPKLDIQELLYQDSYFSVGKSEWMCESMTKLKKELQPLGQLKVEVNSSFILYI